MVIKCIVMFTVILIVFITMSKKPMYKKQSKGKADKQNCVSSDEEMIEYSREKSYQLGFHKKNNSFKRPIVFKRKGITDEEEIVLEAAKKNNPRFSIALETLIPLSKLYTEKNLSNKTIRVFIDTQKDTKIIAIDYSAILEIELNEFYNIAGEFVLINIDKNEDEIKVNFILEDGVVTTEKVK